MATGVRAGELRPQQSAGIRLDGASAGDQHSRTALQPAGGHIPPRYQRTLCVCSAVLWQVYALRWTWYHPLTTAEAVLRFGHDTVPYAFFGLVHSIASVMLRVAL